MPPPPPVVDGVPDPIPPPPADGLHRYVVRLPGAGFDEMAPGQDGTTEDSDTSTDSSGSAEPAEPEPPPMPTEPAWTLDQDLTDQLDEDTVVVFEDGVPGFIDEDGRFVPLSLTAPSSPEAPQIPAPGQDSDSDSDSEGPDSEGSDSDSEGSDSDSEGSDSEGPDSEGPDSEGTDWEATRDLFVEALLDVDGVVSAVAVGDGSYAVAVEEADVLDGLGLHLTADPPLALANDPYGPYQWSFDNTGDNLASLSNPPAQVIDADIDGEEAMAGARGEGVVVAVIDTGVDFSHPDLSGQRWVNEDEDCDNWVDDDNNGFIDDCWGWDFGNEDNEPYKAGQNEHGTHVAGIIASVAGNGVGVAGLAPDAKIMDLNVDGPGGMTTSGVARAVRYAADNGAHIINMSLGTQPGTPAWAVQPMIDAVEYAEAKGVLVVVAAGNSGVDIGTASVYPASIEASNMITVGASAPDETKASFSNYGSPVDIFAPGVLILSTVPDGQFKFMNGTSQASPTTAAVAATVLSAQPGLSPEAVRAQLVGTADERAAYASYGPEPVRLNAARALGLNGDPDQIDVVIRGLTDVTTDGVAVDIEVSDPNDEFPQPYHWEATLVAIGGDGQAYGIVEHPVDVNWQAAETDQRGAVSLLASGTADIRLETMLPAGHYGLLVEAVPDDDPTSRLGEAFLSTFVVIDAPEPTTTTVAPPDATDPDAPSTTSSAGGATTTGPTTTPSTQTSGPSTSTGGPTTSTTSSSTSTVSSSPDLPETTAGVVSPSSTMPATTAAPTPTGPVSTTAPWWMPTTVLSSSSTAATITTPPSLPSSIVSTVPSSTSPVPTPVPSQPSPTTAPPTTGAVQNAGFAVESISPGAGLVGTETMVSIIGTFPSTAYVWFGQQPGTTIYQDQNWIIAVAPASGYAGPIDVTLRSPTYGTVVLVEDGFTYVAGQSPTTTAPTPTPTPTSVATTAPGSTTSPVGPTSSPTAPVTSDTAPSTTGAAVVDDSSTSNPSTSAGPTSSSSSPTTSTSGPGTSSSTSTAGPSTSGPDSSVTSSTGSTSTPTTAAPPTGPQLQFRATAGSTIDLAGGLRGAPLQGYSGFGAVPVCSSEPCRTRRL